MIKRIIESYQRTGKNSYVEEITFVLQEPHQSEVNILERSPNLRNEMHQFFDQNF
jgi:hypothetical protein